MKIGSSAHRDLFCRTFLETHVAFEPERLPWPALEGADLARLRAFPFWSYARTIERRAGEMVTAFAATIADPVIRDAVALQGYEETRHGRLMQHVLERYGIEAPDLDVPPAPPTKADFAIFGFGECTDSFMGFGAFSLAREKRLFPESLLGIFEQVLWEEARHIVFFNNWFRYEEARAGRDRAPGRHLVALRGYWDAIKGTIAGGRAGGVAPEIPESAGATFGEFMDGVAPAQLLRSALAMNDAFMARFDRRLLRPHLVPRLARVTLALLAMLPPRTPAASAASAVTGVAERRDAA